MYEGLAFFLSLRRKSTKKKFTNVFFIGNKRRIILKIGGQCSSWRDIRVPRRKYTR